MSLSKPHEVIYWPIRGLGSPLRAVLTFNGVPFTDTRMRDWHEKDSVTKTRAEQALPFPNLPLLILPNGDALTQTSTLLRYAGSLGSTKPKNEVDEFHVSMVIDHLIEFHSERVKMSYGEQAKENRASFFELSVPYYLGKLEEWMTRRKIDFVATSDYITAADIFFSEFAAAFEKLTGGLEFLKKYPKLTEVYLKVKNHDKLKEYFAKEEKTPFNDPISGAWS